MVIVDTTVWIDYLADADTSQTRWLEARQRWNGISLTDLILCEVLQGFRNEREFERIAQRLRQLPVFDSGGSDMAIASARNCRSLRAQGITIRKTIDCLIATLCIQSGHELLHNDRDFDPFEEHLGLLVIHP